MPVLSHTDEKKEMSVKEFAVFIGISPQTAYRWCEEGRVTHRKPGGLIYIDRADAERLKEETTHTATR
jgi:excisionase family DNA binding protein